MKYGDLAKNVSEITSPKDESLGAEPFYAFILSSGTANSD
jgi:hypothetical protein